MSKKLLLWQKDVISFYCNFLFIRCDRSYHICDWHECTKSIRTESIWKTVSFFSVTVLDLNQNHFWENPSEDRIYQTMWSLLHIQLCTVQYTDDRQRDRGFLSFCFRLLPISNILLDCNKSVNFNFEEREAFSKIHKRYTHVLQISGNLVSFCFFSVHLPYHQINFKISHIGWI